MSFSFTRMQQLLDKSAAMCKDAFKDDKESEDACAAKVCDFLA